MLEEDEDLVVALELVTRAGEFHRVEALLYDQELTPHWLNQELEVPRVVVRRQIAQLDVDVRYRVCPGIEELKEFDAVVLAGGGRVARPDIPGIDLPQVCTFEDVLRCRQGGICGH